MSLSFVSMNTQLFTPLRTFTCDTSVFAFAFWFGQCLAGGTNKFGKVMAVVNVCDVEIVLGAIVGWTKVDGAKQSTTCFGGFHEEVVVANQPENHSIAIDAIIPKHFLGYDFACTTTLVGYILYKVCVASHTIKTD